MIKRIIIVSILLVFMADWTIAQAQEECDYVFEVSYSNCDKITIGNMKAEKGIRFDELKQIRWAKDIENQSLKVWNCIMGCYELLVYNHKKNRVTLVTDRETNTKGWQDDINPFDRDSIYYLLDTLKIPTFEFHSNNVVDKIIIHIGDERVVSTISKSNDRTVFIVPRNVLGKSDKKPVYIDILEKDVEKDWEYAVWRKLYVVPLPLKID